MERKASRGGIRYPCVQEGLKKTELAPCLQGERGGGDKFKTAAGSAMHGEGSGSKSRSKNQKKEGQKGPSFFVKQAGFCKRAGRRRAAGYVSCKLYQIMSPRYHRGTNFCTLFIYRCAGSGTAGAGYSFSESPGFSFLTSLWLSTIRSALI